MQIGPITLLILLAIVIPGGLLLGMTIRKLTVTRCRWVAGFCREQAGRIYLLGALLFLCAAGVAVYQSRWLQGAFLLLIAGVEVFCACRYGRRPGGSDQGGGGGVCSCEPEESAAGSSAEARKEGSGAKPAVDSVDDRAGKP